MAIATFYKNQGRAGIVFDNITYHGNYDRAMSQGEVQPASDWELSFTEKAPGSIVDCAAIGRLNMGIFGPNGLSHLM